MSPTTLSRSRVLLAVLVVVALVSGAAAWMVYGERADRQAEAEHAEAELDELEATRLRIVISDAAFSTLAEQLVGRVESIDAPPSDERFTTLRSASSALAAVVERGRLSDASTALANDVVDAVDRAVGPSLDLWALEEAAYVATSPSSFGSAVSGPDLLLLESVIATSPSLIAIDAASLALVDDLDRFDAELADFIASTASIVEEDPGWFGPDEANPFLGGYLPSEVLAANDPDLLASLSTTAGLSDVWAYDQWLISRLDGVEPAPRPVADIASVAAATQGLMVDRVLNDVDRAIAAAEAPVPGVILDVGWIVLAAVALLALAWLVAMFITRTKRLTEVAFTDALTGVGNRRRLEELQHAWSVAGGPAHAAVAVIDLDRFKLINDSWGHAAGDTVLREIGRGLRSIIDEEAPRCEQVEAVRLGGDEFALVIASAAPRIESTLRDRVAAIGGPIDIGNGERVDVSLSVGVVCAAHPADLSGLIAAADLKAYEAKQQARSVVSLRAGDEVHL